MRLFTIFVTVNNTKDLSLKRFLSDKTYPLKNEIVSSETKPQKCKFLFGISLGWFKPAEIFNKRYEYRKLMDEDVGRSDREPENLDGKPEERGYLETLQASLDFREEKLRKRREEAKQELKDIAFYTILISILRNP